MKYIEWIKFTLKLGIYYIVLDVMVSTEQIRFDQKGRVKKRKKTHESNARPFMPRGDSLVGCIVLESDSPMCPTLKSGVILLSVRFWREVTANSEIEEHLTKMLYVSGADVTMDIILEHTVLKRFHGQ